MYNKEYKQEYLETIRNKTNLYNVETYFKKAGTYESNLGKDLYDFSINEILDYYKSLCTPSLDLLMVINNQFKMYTAKALNDSVIKDSQNHYDEITNTLLRNCINLGLAEAKVLDRKDLLFILESDAVENPNEKFLALAFFEGISGTNLCEFFDLTIKNFDIEKKEVHLSSGRILSVSDDLIKWAIISSETYKYSNGNSAIENKNFKLDDNRIVKSFCNNIKESPRGYYRSLLRRMNELQSKTNCWGLGYGALRESGRLQMMRDISKEKNISYHKALYDKDLIYRYGKVGSRTRYLLKYGYGEE